MSDPRPKVGKLHFIVVGDNDRGGSSSAASEIAAWVKQSGSSRTAVP
ncbi:hypothetical protein [Streptomyces akebiae]|uniref:Uncharacterized protein n=1 Tax=Streptomyces akebiae TaxID=2865673 RepID=A0ABX8XUS0_9ACTN|nr:hypothetical protein [Streptomyces akebiae]QYX79379.1 hypothetical protein K1J60_25250 [Streptomyces akebiae]